MRTPGAAASGPTTTSFPSSSASRSSTCQETCGILATASYLTPSRPDSSARGQGSHVRNQPPALPAPPAAHTTRVNQPCPTARIISRRTTAVKFVSSGHAPNATTLLRARRVSAPAAREVVCHSPPLRGGSPHPPRGKSCPTPPRATAACPGVLGVLSGRAFFGGGHKRPAPTLRPVGNHSHRAPDQPATPPPLIQLDEHNISYYSKPMTAVGRGAPRQSC